MDDVIFSEDSQIFKIQYLRNYAINMHRVNAKKFQKFFLNDLFYKINNDSDSIAPSSQRRVSSSRTNRPCIPFGARCRGHVEIMWSAVCSEAPHSQFGQGAAPHLYMDEWNRPTPVRRRFSFTQDVLGKPIPRGLGLALGIKA